MGRVMDTGWRSDRASYRSTRGREPRVVWGPGEQRSSRATRDICGSIADLMAGILTLSVGAPALPLALIHRAALKVHWGQTAPPRRQPYVNLCATHN